MSKSAIRRILTNPAVQAVVFTILLLVLTYTSFYIDGIRGGISFSFYAVMIIPVYLILMLLPLVRAIIGVCSSFWRIRAISRESIMSVVVLVVVVAAPLTAFFVAPSGAEVFLKGFEKWVTNEVDTDNIQLWIQSADERHWESRIWYGTTYPAEKSIPEEFPNFLKDFKPKYLWFERSKLDGSKIIRFEWGGAFFHWSLVIGDPNMKMPEQTVEWFSDRDVEFRRILKPGVYVYSGG